MSSTKSETRSRPRSWFGIKLGSRNPKHNQDGTDTILAQENKCADKKKEGKSSKAGGKKDKDILAKNISKGHGISKAQCVEKRSESYGAKSGKIVNREGSSVPSGSRQSSPPNWPVGNLAVDTEQNLHPHSYGSVGDNPDCPRLKPLLQNNQPSENAGSNHNIASDKNSEGKTKETRAIHPSAERAFTPCSVTEHHPRLLQNQQQLSPMSKEKTGQKDSRVPPVAAPHPGITNSPSIACELSCPKLNQVCSASPSSQSKSTTAASLPPASISTTAATAASSTATSGVTTPTVKIAPTPRYNLNFLGDLQSKHKFSLAICKQNDVANSGNPPN
ncbi:hypothetical protein EGW08_018288 [Elysia chlorotica]|uniref:Uncharacterized protein n=1 Tax=Elysia chlorotica TaxID=188477 RepID=A0A3S1AWC9_ELYCH|nr:hypothetical protein EGW08_018288 [Elysia chlorotica]